MPIYDRSYRRWDGELKRHAFRFILIATMGIRNALSSKWGWFITLLFWALLFVSMVPFMLFFFVNYAIAFRPKFLPAQFFQNFDALRPYAALQYPLLVRVNTLFLMPYTVFFGSGLIARDRATGALSLYLSRPLSLFDYICGKASVLGWFLSCLTLFPCLALWLFSALASDAPHAFRDALPQLLPIFIQNLTIVAVFTFSMLAVSAICRRPMFAALIWFTLVIILPTMTSVLATQFDWNAAAALSPNDAFFAIGYNAFDIGGLHDRAQQAGGGTARYFVNGFFEAMSLFNRTPVEWCWISVAGWVALSLGVLVLSLRRQEVVGESARR